MRNVKVATNRVRKCWR